jgi:hypothetical protein
VLVGTGEQWDDADCHSFSTWMAVGVVMRERLGSPPDLFCKRTANEKAAKCAFPIDRVLDLDRPGP